MSAAPAATTPPGTSVSQLTIVDPNAAVVGSLSPTQAYVPLNNPNQNNTAKNAASVKSFYAEGRWLATATDKTINPVVAQTAAEYAAAADKNVGVIATPH